MKTEQDFAAELEEMRAKLQASGRNAKVVVLEEDLSGIRCDFDLPYSTMPALSGSRWNYVD